MNKRLLLQASGWMLGLMWLSGCVADAPEGPGEEIVDRGHIDHHAEEGRTEGRPLDDGVFEKSGQVNCSERRDTGYDGGRSFAITVVNVDGKPVEKATAEAYYKMQQAASRDGVHLRIVSGFRTHGEQQYLYGCYVNCNCNNCNLAAYPGYSNHQSGYALDLNTADRGVYGWLSRNGARFGFKRTVPSEDWHWEYFGGGPSGSWPCSGGGGGGSQGGGNQGGGACGAGPKYTVPSGGSCWEASEALGCGTSELVNCSGSRGCSALWAGDVLTCQGGGSQGGDQGADQGGDQGGSQDGGSCQTYRVERGGSCWEASQELGCGTSELVNCTAGSLSCGALWVGDVLACGSGCCP